MKRKLFCGIGCFLFFTFFALTAFVMADDDAIMDVDNHAATFTGTWGTSTAKILYYGDDYRYAWGSGSGTSTATATFATAQTADIDGYYAVYARWTTDPNRHNAVTYHIYNGVSDTTSQGSCTLNQTINGGAWQYCDTVYLSAGKKGVVKIENGNVSANRVIVADAIRFVRVSVDGGDVKDNSLTGTDIMGESIYAWDTKDEPGLDYSNHLYYSISSLSTSYSSMTDIKNISVTLPRAGYVTVQAIGQCEMSVVDKEAGIVLSDTSGGSDHDTWIHFCEKSSTEGRKGYAGLVLSHTYYFSSGGTKTFYLKGYREDGANGVLWIDSFTATYYPTKY